MGKIAQQYTLQELLDLVKNNRGEDYFLEIAKGNVPKHSNYSATGLNSDVDTATTPETIWGYGGVFTPPVTYRIHNFVSTSANDTSAGTGLRTVRIYGVTSSGLETEDIIMNGLVNVATVKSYIDIYDLVPLTFGSGGTNAGQITATSQVDATVTISMEANGENTAYRAVRYIPVGYTGYLYFFKSAMSQATASSFVEICLKVKINGYWVCKGMHLLNNSGNSNETDDYIPRLKLDNGTWVKIECTSVTNNNTKVYGDIGIVLVKD